MKHLIEKYHIKAKKSLGQNFLINEDVLDEITQITPITGSNILEIGPWFGALTQKLIQNQPSALTLVELDDLMVEILQDRIAQNDLDVSHIQFEIIHKDILKVEPSFTDYKVIANIPYYITSPILYKFLYEVKNKPENMIILMQKEVWERIVNKKSSVLSLFVQKKCTVSEKIFVPRNFFSPPPKVDSSVLFFQIHDVFDNVSDEIFMKFIKSAFLNPRKKMINNLAQSGYNKQEYLQKLISLWYTENTRAEELSIENYISLLTL